MKKQVRSVISAVLLVCILASSFVAAKATEISPRYTGITVLTSGLTISDVGKATCNGKVMLRNGYTADLTVELKRDGTTIKTWTASGTEMVSVSGTYYVLSGHTYVVTTSATVYDANGTVVDSVSKDSPSKDY